MMNLKTRHTISVAAFLLALALAATGCGAFGTDDSEVAISGTVLNSTTLEPVQDAVVTVRFTDNGDEEEITLTTDAEGQFSAIIEVDEAVDVTISASSGGVSAQTVESVSPDFEEVTDIELELDLGEDADREPGSPENITLAEQSTDAIRVQESGGEEVANLTFQVVDSTGTPIGSEETVEVDFRFGEQPGDATLEPETVTTDGGGNATANVISGETAGSVQVVAETEKDDGTVISAKPVQLAIHGGLPNKCHFTLAPDQTNFPGLVELGATKTVAAIVGDKFGNPVVPGTNVSFSANAGVIDGSMQTNDAGQGSVTLTAAQPLPTDGVGTVRAETAGTDDVNVIVDPSQCPDPAETGNENEIFETVPVVFSGRPEVGVEPSTAQLDQTYELTVTDVENGNPLAPGTTISVEAEGTRVQATGNTSVTLDDTTVEDDGTGSFEQDNVVTGEGITDFTFRVVEEEPGEEEEDPPSPSVEAITINVSGPNGQLEIALLNGDALSKQTVEVAQDAEIQSKASGRTVIRAPEEE